MRSLRDSYRDDARVAALAAALAEDREHCLGGVQGGAFAVLIAALAARGTRPVLILAHDPAGLVAELEELGTTCVVLPELDRFAEASGTEAAPSADRTGHARRLAALEAFQTGALLIASPVAATQPVPDLREVAASSVVIRTGQTCDLGALVESLAQHGYAVAPQVDGRGSMAVRGGILDVFPWLGSEALRLEFFGDTVESIRRFDIETQETVSRTDEAVLAAGGGLLATCQLFDQLPPGPLFVLGDAPLRSRLSRDHGRREVRLARLVESGAEDAGFTTIERLRGELSRGLGDLARVVAELGGTAPILLARNDESRRELSGHCADAGIAADLRLGRLSAGFRDNERGVVVVHDFELAARTATRRARGRIAGGTPLSSLTDLRRGDYVVHLHHGIGVFRGMATLEKRGFQEDFLLLEFAGGTKLYVPVDAIELVQKYVGATGRSPELSTIGAAAWQKKRARAEQAIQDLSAELLRSQVARLAHRAPACAADSAAVRRFEATFPFEETEDQLAGVREIKADLERPHAMDRLLCGDVGFGKTEVAIRAAFKAVDSGLQVAVLVPTTLLAEQHLETFRARFESTGVRVEGLNRFRAGKEANAILAAATAGNLDILIGTHAILTQKLRFARLGLVIIDEEHRFGVKQKERLRAMLGAVPTAGSAPSASAGETLTAGDAESATTAENPPESGSASPAETSTETATKPGFLAPHVLTLSATPIPRTLHFSLLGIRDISVLAEAPAERLAVETRVAVFDDELVRHAIARERERGGQCFVVHNRVDDLDVVAARFARLAPGLKLDVLHGQMAEDDVARVMDAFRTGALECLVSTSIVESGIDIPNANTLFVHNAQHFGLAELHQLRGRIGRFTHQAYAYFLVPSSGGIGEDARARLDAIQEYAELGAGFKLAMRDLELRGAGNLLGAEQSGHIDAIGYELYTRLLGEAVTRAKAAAAALHGLPPLLPDGSAPPAANSAAHSTPNSSAANSSPLAGSGGVVLGMGVDAYIPDDWLEAPALKFELHKHVDAARRQSDLASIARRARDRFGTLPPPVVRLFQAKAVRLAASDLGLKRIDLADRQIRIHLAGPLPRQLAAVQLPEIVHVQLDSLNTSPPARSSGKSAPQTPAPTGPRAQILVLFVKPTLDPDTALRLLCALFALDLGYLGKGF